MCTWKPSGCHTPVEAAPLVRMYSEVDIDECTAFWMDRCHFINAISIVFFNCSVLSFARSPAPPSDLAGRSMPYPTYGRLCDRTLVCRFGDLSGEWLPRTAYFPTALFLLVDPCLLVPTLEFQLSAGLIRDGCRHPICQGRDQQIVDGDVCLAYDVRERAIAQLVTQPL